MNGPFAIQPQWLRELDETQGTKILHAMLYAEARMCEGIDSAKIEMTVSNEGVKTPDGGIDGSVRDAHPGPGNHGIIKEGDTYYQVKTSRSADVTTKNKARETVTKSKRQDGALTSRTTYPDLQHGHVIQDDVGALQRELKETGRLVIDCANSILT